MWSTSDEPPGTMEGDSPESMVHGKDKCEQNKNQLEYLKEIMLKNKQSLKKKEEEVQEYARRLSKIKSRTTLSRRSKEASLPYKDVSHTPETSAVDISEETIDDISQAKTAKAKSTLLQKKLAENRKVFEQRNKEITETKRAVEEKVEAIRQQLEESDITAMGFQKDQLPVAPIQPVMITSDIMSPKQIESIQEKENEIALLNKKILELQATVVDLQENLKEKDSVIESKMKAVTLMSADFSKRGKTTLDTLEDTKDEMRTMQEHFILLETSLKNKNESLLLQLQERDDKIAELEDSVNRFEQQANEQKLSTSVDSPQSAADTLAETKEVMKSMQEHFVLIESSLKAKNDNLLQQLNENELKLAEANERIFQLESGIGIVKDPTVDDLQYKLDKVEQSNKQLQDEKYELQKNIAELQDKILNFSVHGNGAIIEKDNRISELENLIEELKQSNQLLEEESKAELQRKLADLTVKNEEYSNKIADLESLVHELEEQKSDIAAKLSDQSNLKEDEKVAKLTKELEDLNKSMIKIKAQHRSKVRNLQKQLENVKKVSDTNAELVRLGNQVALLEEEKASAGDWQERVIDLESKVSAQTKEIEMQIEAIATLENQKLDLMQELHLAKQEISSLEAENAESENLRVTAEMKVVDLEEQLEAVHKLQNANKLESSSEVNYTELIKQVEALTQENTELYSRISKLEGKRTSETGSTESFEAIQELDKSDLLKKIEDLMHKNNELTLKITRFEEKENTQSESTDWLEPISERDKNELLKKIDQLTQENTDLIMKLSRIEEKGSSDTGSTESFERIPEHTESMTKIELLTQENNELVIKCTKLKEQLENIMETEARLKQNIESLKEEDENKSLELLKLTAQVRDLVEENDTLQKQIEALITENKNLKDHSFLVEPETPDSSERLMAISEIKTQIDTLTEEKNLLEKNIEELRSLVQSSNATQNSDINELSIRTEELLKENERIASRLSEVETYNQKLKEDLTEVTLEKEKLQADIDQMVHDNSSKAELEISEQSEDENRKKRSVQDKEETSQPDESLSQQSESIIVSLEREIEECKKLIAEQTGLIEEMKIKLANKEEELEKKGKQIEEYEASGKKVESLEDELKEMFSTVDEWKHKCNEMQEKMEKLEAGKASIEEGFRMLQNDNKILLEENKEKSTEANQLKQQLQDTITMFELKLQERITEMSEKETEITNLKQTIEDKDQELHAKYTELQNKMILIDSLQDECNDCKMLLQEKNNMLSLMSDELAKLNNAMKSKEDEIYTLKKHVDMLNEKVEESKPLKDYNELLEQLKNKDMILDELHCRINATTKENSNLLEKVKNLSQQNNNIQSELADKQKELVDLVAAREHLEAEIAETKSERDEAEGRVRELQSIIDNNSKFVDDLQAELRSCYKMIEQLKVKHTEDVELQNQRLESIIEELNSKTQECETLRDELQEKERLGQDITEGIKIALEAKIADLKQKLKESKDKIQMQLEKMKKLAANLKKKTTVCQELESRVTELEEKWMTEKDEKEAKNKQIQDVEAAMREKDNRITDLEEKLIQARNETSESFKHIDALTNDLTNTKEKMTLLTQQIQEMEGEIDKLRMDLESRTAELANERDIKENIIAEYESYKKQVIQENERKQFELEEVKEKARELSVRMQVMEAEYVEQLALIKNLKAENGLLLSKQTQINEKLENVEKESEERRLLIEQMQKATVDAVTETTQTSEEESTEEEGKIGGAQRYDHCKQCQTLVQALEAKLQEREAEIENLDNELANSIGNFVRMNQISVRNRSLEDPYNDLLFQYNSLISSHEEAKAKLEETMKENKELMEKIESLQSANSTLEETTTTTVTEQTSEDGQQEQLQITDLAKKCEEREAELLNLQREMQIVQEHANELEQQLNSQTILLKSAEDAKNSLQQEIESLRSDKDTNHKLIDDLKTELEGYRNQSAEPAEKSVTKREAVALDQQDNAPPLFDATKIFGASFAFDSDLVTNNEAKQLQALLDEKEAQCSNLTQEINHLQKLMIEERSQMSQNYSQCVQELEISQSQLKAALESLERSEQTLSEKDAQIHNLNLQIMKQRNDTDDRSKELLLAKDGELEELRTSLDSMKKALDEVTAERDQQNALLESYKLQVENLEVELKNSTDPELIQELESRVSSTTQQRDLLQLQVNDLSRSMAELKSSMEAELEKAARERDEAKELVANLTQALEDIKTPTITETSTKESTPYDEAAQVQLEVVSEDNKEESASKIVPGASSEVAANDGTAWDAEKLNVDEETWGWDADDAPLASEHLNMSLIPSAEMQLQAKVDELEDKIKDLEKERDKVLEESKAAQLKNGKMIKKLKEYKVQVDSLQQQLKMQKSTSVFYELDSAIEEELKSQISNLEKTLGEIKEELKNTVAEKEALTKRLDVVVSANERYMEMKERQDMDMEVLRIRNKELSEKMETLEKRLQAAAATPEDGDLPQNESVASKEESKSVTQEQRLRKRSVETEDYESLCKKYKNEIDDLKNEMEALASENELLQHFLEEQKVKLSSLEKKQTADENESIEIVDNLNKKISELQAMLSKSREEYDLLRKQYEQSLMDANDQVTAMRQNTDFLKEEALEKIGKLETEIADLRQQLESSELSVVELRKSLQDVSQEKASLEEKLTSLTASSEKQLSSLNASMAEVTDLLNIRIQEVADLKQELQRQYVNHEEVKMKLQEGIQSLNQELGEKKQQLEGLKKSLSDKENEFIQQQSVETVSALVSQATQELVQKHAIEAEEKEKQIQSLQGKLSMLETAVNEYSVEKQNQLARIDAQQRELELLKQNLTEKNSVLESLQANLAEKERELLNSLERVQGVTAENQNYLETIEQLQQSLYEFKTSSVDTNELLLRIQSLETSLAEKKSIIQRYAQESNEFQAILESNKIEIAELRAETQKIDALRSELAEKTERIDRLSSELEETRKVLEETRQTLNEKICLLDKCNHMLSEREIEPEKPLIVESNQQGPSHIVDGLPLFRMSDDNHGYQQTIDAMQADLEKKQQEIEHLKYVLSENTYPGIIREMQDTINCLYDEKAELKSSLDTASQKVDEKEREIDVLTERLKTQNQETEFKEQASRLSMEDQERIVALQNELHAKEQEINELKYVLAQKDSQLSLQASMEPQSDDFELREMVERLTSELYGKEQEVQQLKSAIAELQTEVSRLRKFERTLEESKAEAQELLQRKLYEKEREIDEMLQRLAAENQRTLNDLQLRERDIENLKRQLEGSSEMERTMKEKLEQKEESLARVSSDLAEKERRLAELSITKDTELHNLKVQIHEKDARIEELLLLSDEEERQLNELKSIVDAKEKQITSLKKIFEDKVKEAIQNVMKKNTSGNFTDQPEETSTKENQMSTSQELDLALYMLHQRDVKCEELTHELMQLLEERDTLQLRLSNAIRVNEELRRMGSGDPSPRNEPSTSVSEEPMVEHPSPSKSEGPVEIAKEAIDAPIGEDKEALALKLSQLHTVSHAKDVRLKDERELRHTQQMSFLMHNDVLSTLPPEAAARLVNANYTLSRDVQSQSSVLLNWLWGKSTPKVVHM